MSTVPLTTNFYILLIPKLSKYNFHGRFLYMNVVEIYHTNILFGISGTNKIYK